MRQQQFINTDPGSLLCILQRLSLFQQSGQEIGIGYGVYPLVMVIDSTVSMAALWPSIMKTCLTSSGTRTADFRNQLFVSF